MLVVDDERNVTSVLRKILSRDYLVETAASAAQAFAMLAVDPDAYDLILCDLEMPNACGMEFVTMVRERHPDLEKHVIIMTGGALGWEHQAFVEQLGAAVLAKPFEFAVLRETVGTRLRPPR